MQVPRRFVDISVLPSQTVCSKVRMIPSFPAPGADATRMALVSDKDCVRIFPHRVTELHNKTRQVQRIASEQPHQMTSIVKHPAKNEDIDVWQLALLNGLAKRSVHHPLMGLDRVTPKSGHLEGCFGRSGESSTQTIQFTLIDCPSANGPAETR